jgi:hypothetical protein
MGADKPETRTPSTNEQSGFSTLLIGAVVLLVAVALFKNAGIQDDFEAPKLNPKEEAKLQKRLKEIDDSEQYALVAKMDGWYPCLHSGKATCYLLAGEVWKYGVTSKGEFGRYKAMFMERNKVSYIIEFKGNIAECLKQEQIKLFNYPYLPENLARTAEERLPRPPYNPIMR